MTAAGPPAVKSNVSKQRIRVPGGLYLQSRFFAATQSLWRALGALESTVLREELEEIPVSRPIYVTSLARSGTTILTEMLERHPDLTSHHYSDFPNVWTPYWRNYLLQKTRRQAPAAEERAHRDRIMVSQDSPEAVEEVLWMHFFPASHADGVNNALGADCEHPGFEQFYRDHIRKLLLVRNTGRYLAKGNYNVARLPYIQKLFADARFLIPYRNPAGHIGSLAKQHRLFQTESGFDQRIGQQLAMSGHFEFGPRRSALHFGDAETWESIMSAWSDGREIEGWALYWASTYGYLLQQLKQSPALRDACLFFSYERLCEDSDALIDRVLAHCELSSTPFRSVKRHYVDHLRPPDYYDAGFSPAERALIDRVCAPTKAALDEIADTQAS